MRHVDSKSQLKKEEEKTWEEKNVKLYREGEGDDQYEYEVVTTQSVSHSDQPVPAGEMPFSLPYTVMPAARHIPSFYVNT